MPTPGFGTSPFVLPQLFDKPGDALQQGLLNKERRDQRQFEINYRLQKEKEAEDWKKLAMIREFTNIDQHHTGEQVADAIGDKKMAELLNKYTLASSSMSPMQIQAELPKETQKTITALDAMKDELVQSDKNIEQIKQLYPGLLDTQAMRQAHREEILHRRIGSNGEFNNPLDVLPSKYDFNNPETLADFMPQDSDKIVSQEILDPKLYQTKPGAMGNRDTYTKFQEKLSPFAKTNLTPESYNQDLFVKPGIKPEISFDSQKEDLFGQKVETLSPEAYKTGFSQKADLAFIAMAKRSVPHWDALSADDKDKYIRGIALNYVKKLDKSGYSFENANPPAARSTTINKFGADEMAINDIYNRMDKEVNRLKDAGVNRFHVGILDSDAQKLVLDFAKEATGDKEISNKDVFIEKSDSGDLNLWNADRKLIGTLPRVGVNIKVQPSVKEKRAVIEQGNVPSKTSSEYSNITETNKGTIGVKNGKWYDIKTGKPIQ